VSSLHSQITAKKPKQYIKILQKQPMKVMGWVGMWCYFLKAKIVPSPIVNIIIITYCR